MTIISVRISEKDKSALRKHGRISSVIKEAIAMYLDSQQSKKTIKRLKELQKQIAQARRHRKTFPSSGRTEAGSR